MGKKWKAIHKRKKIGGGFLSGKEENSKIDIAELSDRELGYAIKNELIKWHDIKKWAERKSLEKFK